MGCETFYEAFGPIITQLLRQRISGLRMLELAAALSKFLLSSSSVNLEFSWSYFYCASLIEFFSSMKSGFFCNGTASLLPLDFGKSGDISDEHGF